MPTRLSCRSRLSVLLLAITLLSSCGSGGPTIPEGPRERTFTGRLSVPTADSLGGLFHLTTIVNSQFTGVQPETHPVLAAMRRWLVTPLIAQGTSGSTTGNLITNTGELVPLTGTYAGGSFSVTGGGYATAAQVNATGNLSGSGTAPGGGSGSVTALPTPSTAPPSSQPTGTYVGTFEMTTAIRSRNWNHSGVLIGTCLHPLRFSGDVTMHVSRIGDTNQMTGHLRIEWSELAAGGSTCPPNAFPNRLNEWVGIDYDGVLTGLNPVDMRSGPAGPGNAGTITGSIGFSGVVSGNTVVGTLFFTRVFDTPVPEGRHFETLIPTPMTTVTLTKQ